MGKPSFFFFLRNIDSTNGNRCGGFCPRGYVSVAEALSSTDVEDNVSGADEVQELLPEMRKEEEKEEHLLTVASFAAEEEVFDAVKSQSRLVPDC